MACISFCNSSTLHCISRSVVIDLQIARMGHDRNQEEWDLVMLLAVEGDAM